MDSTFLLNKNRKTRHLLLSVTLGLCTFLTDHPQITFASLFDTNQHSISTQSSRTPAAIAQQKISYDCSKPKPTLETTTEFETFRLVLVHCPKDVTFKNERHNIKLHTFRTGKSKSSSEFAYLQRGENKFILETSGKSISINVIRLDQNSL